MQTKSKYRFLIIVLLSCIYSVCLNGLSAQTGGVEKPRLKDFGSSLRQTTQNIKQESEVNKKAITDDDEIIKVDTELVINDFLVMDKKGRSINNLQKSDFVVVEDDKPQEIGTFEQGDNGTIGRSFVLVLDYSGSLLPYIETSVEAAKVLIDKLKPADRMAIVTDNVELINDFTRDKTLLKSKLDNLKNDALRGKVGRSEQYSALMATLNELFDDEDVRPIVIFQTDGDELGFLKGNYVKPRVEYKNPEMIEILKGFNLKEKTFSYEDVITKSDETRATVYTIIPGVKFLGVPDSELLERGTKSIKQRQDMKLKIFGRTPLQTTQKNADSFAVINAHMLQRMHLSIANVAKHTGGWTDYLETPEQADQVYSRVLSGINMRYVIGYYPTNQMRDGKRRKVNITVRNHPEYVVWGRKVYIPREQ